MVKERKSLGTTSYSQLNTSKKTFEVVPKLKSFFFLFSSLKWSLDEIDNPNFINRDCHQKNPQIISNEKIKIIFFFLFI